jgi:hypothetical protein
MNYVNYFFYLIEESFDVDCEHFEEAVYCDEDCHQQHDLRDDARGNTLNGFSAMQQTVGLFHPSRVEEFALPTISRLFRRFFYHHENPVRYFCLE